MIKSKNARILALEEERAKHRHALAEAPSAVAEEVIRALEDGTPLHVFPDPHSKQLATIMRPFLTRVGEGGDVYNQGK